MAEGRWWSTVDVAVAATPCLESACVPFFDLPGNKSEFTGPSALLSPKSTNSSPRQKSLTDVRALPEQLLIFLSHHPMLILVQHHHFLWSHPYLGPADGLHGGGDQMQISFFGWIMSRAFLVWHLISIFLDLCITKLQLLLTSWLVRISKTWSGLLETEIHT